MRQPSPRAASGRRWARATWVLRPASTSPASRTPPPSPPTATTLASPGPTGSCSGAASWQMAPSPPPHSCGPGSISRTGRATSMAWGGLLSCWPATSPPPPREGPGSFGAVALRSACPPPTLPAPRHTWPTKTAWRRCRRSASSPVATCGCGCRATSSTPSWPRSRLRRWPSSTATLPSSRLPRESGWSIPKPPRQAYYPCAPQRTRCVGGTGRCSITASRRAWGRMCGRRR
mmetsp:Transcript_20711/g.64977  ORF Transcript_20711/g.64977 Transcript_20711/m.64977 type:complete len:232 (+) Transcript_20711:895-1590(+)